MIDRPGAQDCLGAAEQVLDLQQVAVAEHRLQRGDAGIGAQHEDAVVAGLVGAFAGISASASLRRTSGGRRPP